MNWERTIEFNHHTIFKLKAEVLPIFTFSWHTGNTENNWCFFQSSVWRFTWVLTGITLYSKLILMSAQSSNHKCSAASYFMVGYCIAHYYSMCYILFDLYLVCISCVCPVCCILKGQSREGHCKLPSAITAVVYGISLWDLFVPIRYQIKYIFIYDKIYYVHHHHPIIGQ